MKRDDFEAWTRDFYSDLACASDTWSDEKGAYTDCAHHMAWHLWQYSQSRLESLEQEMQEQARIIGMGVERELALVAKVESLEKDAKFLNWCADRFVHVYGESECVDFVLKLRSIAAMQANKGE